MTQTGNQYLNIAVSTTSRGMYIILSLEGEFQYSTDPNKGNIGIVADSKK